LDLGAQIKPLLLEELARFLRRWVMGIHAWSGAGG
jgi:hypothetical protein